MTNATAYDLEIVQKDLIWKNGIGYLKDGARPKLKNNEFEKLWEKEQQFPDWAIRKAHIKTIQKAVSYRKTQVHCLQMGIGSGAFLQELNKNTQLIGHGVDYHMPAVHWLAENKLHVKKDVYDVLIFLDTFGDHQFPKLVLENYKPKFVIISLPIFQDKQQIYNSEYFGVGKGCWYFSRKGLIDYMKDAGYGLLDWSAEEQKKYGVLNKMTFVFTTIDMYEV